MSTNKEDMINDMLKSLSQKLGSNSNEIKKAAQKNDFSNILKNMNSNDAKKLEDVLNSKEKTQKILSSPQAQQLINKLLGEKRNG